MLSALIPSELSYPAVQLVPKPVDQRFVHGGPLVLSATSLKYQTPAADKDQPVSRIESLVTKCVDYTITPIKIGGPTF